MEGPLLTPEWQVLTSKCGESTKLENQHSGSIVNIRSSKNH